MLARILNDPTIETSELVRIEDLTTIEQARTLHETSAARIILEDGELDPLLKWYQANGYEIRDGSLVLKANIKGPFHGPVQAAKNYYHNQIHPPGSANAELGRLHHVGAGSLIPAGVKAFGVGVAYYPARFAEKLLTYTPRNSLLDVTDANTVTLLRMEPVNLNITLPPSPVANDVINIWDIGGQCSTNPIHLLRNGKKIKKSEDIVALDNNGIFATLVYKDETYGWLIKSNVN